MQAYVTALTIDIAAECCCSLAYIAILACQNSILGHLTDCGGLLQRASAMSNPSTSNGSGIRAVQLRSYPGNGCIDALVAVRAGDGLAHTKVRTAVCAIQLFADTELETGVVAADFPIGAIAGGACIT